MQVSSSFSAFSKSAKQCFLLVVLIGQLGIAPLFGPTFLPKVEAAKWTGLSFDSKYFLCDQFEPLCVNILEEIGCSSNATQRIILGCPGYPAVPNNITNFVGTCTCLSPTYYDVAGSRVTQELIQNRIVPEMNWMLEPWNSGPPYDMKTTYTEACSLLLDRLGCENDYQIIYAYDQKKGTATGSNFKCSCGAFNIADLHLHRIILDQINSYNLKVLPIFSNPVYLSVPVSICITLICGKLGAILAVYLNLPPIIGFLLAGVGIQNILNPMFIEGAGFPFPSPASELKVVALVIVLMRAGLSIKFDEIRQNSVATATLSLIPYMCEFFIFLYVGAGVFGWQVVDMGLFASIMAPLGPSVVISTLLMFIADKNKKHGYTPKQILISTPIEAVIAIVMFGIFSTLVQQSANPLYPWVKIYPLYANCLFIPLNIIFSSVLGMVLGWFVSLYINYRVKVKNDYVWVRISKNPQMGSSTADLVFVLLVSCYVMYSLCNVQYIQSSSGVLVVFVCCITVSRLCDPDTCIDIAQGLKGIWVFAEVFLFTLTGVSLSFDSSNGPMYGQRGLSSDMMQKLLGMIFIGTCGRIVGLGVCMLLIFPSQPKHRQKPHWYLPFWLNCWIYQLPKATVQATLGSVAYTQHIIPGAIGLNESLLIAQSTAFTVLIFAPIGTFLMKFVGSPISSYLERLDKEAGWNSMKSTYYATLTTNNSSSGDDNVTKPLEPGERDHLEGYMPVLHDVESQRDVIDDDEKPPPASMMPVGVDVGIIANLTEPQTRSRRSTLVTADAAGTVTRPPVPLASAPSSPKSDGGGGVELVATGGSGYLNNRNRSQSLVRKRSVSGSSRRKQIQLQEPETIDVTVSRAGYEVINFLQRYNASRQNRTASNADRGGGDHVAADAHPADTTRARSVTSEVIDFLAKRLPPPPKPLNAVDEEADYDDDDEEVEDDDEDDEPAAPARRWSTTSSSMSKKAPPVGERHAHFDDSADAEQVDHHHDHHERAPKTRGRTTTADVIDFLVRRLPAVTGTMDNNSEAAEVDRAIPIPIHAYPPPVASAANQDQSSQGQRNQGESSQGQDSQGQGQEEKATAVPSSFSGRAASVSRMARITEEEARDEEDESHSEASPPKNV